MTTGSTRHLCIDARAALVPFLEGLRLLGIPRATGERMLRRCDPRLPPTHYIGRRRYIMRPDMDVALMQHEAREAERRRRVQHAQQSCAQVSGDTDSGPSPTTYQYE